MSRLAAAASTLSRDMEEFGVCWLEGSSFPDCTILRITVDAVQRVTSLNKSGMHIGKAFSLPKISRFGPFNTADTWFSKGNSSAS
jgi:predicted glycosyl hydrolase (DUF1957 family)